MNYWTQLSIDFANQRNYLDELFRVYPTIPEGIRDIDDALWQQVEDAFNRKDNETLVKTLLKFDIFPIKDSYVAYLISEARPVSPAAQSPDGEPALRQVV